MRPSLLLLLLVVLTLGGCSNLPREAESHAFRYFDFSKVKTYAFYDRNADFFDYQSLSGVMRNNIELAIEEELDLLGLTYQTVANADIIVTYFWVKHPGKALTQYNKGINYCAACLNIKSATNQQQSQKITAKTNSLIIDIIDPIKKRSVWRSSYPLKIAVKENSQEVQSKIKTAVKQMLKQYAQLGRV